MKRKKTKAQVSQLKKRPKTKQSNLEVSQEPGVAFGSEAKTFCESEAKTFSESEAKTFCESEAKMFSESEAREHTGFRVLIPINSQDSALYSLEAAMARRWPDDTQFMLTTVIENLASGNREDTILHRDALLAEQNEHRTEMHKWLSRIKQSFRTTFPNTDSDLECGRISEKICEVASNWGADYIMIGSHDFNLIDRMALGSIASKVLMDAPCTVEAVRFNRLKRQTPVAGVLDAEAIRQLANQAPSRIIVATNFSPQSAAAIQWIADSHWFASTQIRLVHVTEASKREPGVSFLAGSKNYISEQQYQRNLEDRLRKLGNDIAQKQPRCKLEVFVLQSNSVSEAILELASIWDADLVVMGAKDAGCRPDEQTSSTALPIMDSLACSTIAIRSERCKQVHFSWYPDLQEPGLQKTELQIPDLHLTQSGEKA